MRRIVTCVVGIALVASACSGDGASENPKAALTDALTATAEWDAFTYEFTIESTPESLRAALAEGGPNVPKDAAETILDSSISASQTAEQDPAEAKARFVVTIGGADAIELRTLNDALYARADVKALLEAFGQDPSTLDPFVQQAAQAGLDFVEPAVEGKWLVLDGLGGLVRSLAPNAPSPPSEEQSKEALEELARAVEEEAEVRSEGSDDTGEHLVVTLPLRPLFTRFLDTLSGVSNVPLSQLPDGREIANEEVTADVWIADGELAQLEFDLLQVEDFGEPLPEGVEQLALRAQIEEWDAELQAPEDAVTIDPRQIFQLIFAPMQEVDASAKLKLPPKKVRVSPGG